MRYPRNFLDLQVRFAEHVAAISDIPLARALIDYTNLYVRFGLGRDFQPAHPVWQSYLAGLGGNSDAREWTYRFYRSRDTSMAGPPVAASFGCFSYTPLTEDRIRLHFHNADTVGGSSLARFRVEERRADLAALFDHVRRILPDDVRVVGISWLYNLDAYRRLFPPAYIATARVARDRFRYMPLWGQFLDRHEEVRDAMARSFLARLERERRLEHLSECFPFQTLAVEAPAREFHDFYGL